MPAHQTITSVPRQPAHGAAVDDGLEDEISAGADRSEECCDKQTRAQTSLSWLADTLLSQHRTARIKFCRPTATTSSSGA